MLRPSRRFGLRFVWRSARQSWSGTCKRRKLTFSQMRDGFITSVWNTSWEDCSTPTFVILVSVNPWSRLCRNLVLSCLNCVRKSTTWDSATEGLAVWQHAFLIRWLRWIYLPLGMGFIISTGCSSRSSRRVGRLKSRTIGDASVTPGKLRVLSFCRRSCSMAGWNTIMMTVGIIVPAGLMQKFWMGCPMMLP